MLFTKNSVQRSAKEERSGEEGKLHAALALLFVCRAWMREWELWKFLKTKKESLFTAHGIGAGFSRCNDLARRLFVGYGQAS